ncbi:MAG: ornithine cyclodeaminase family protein [Ferrimicrobium sp.]|jgi:ornithine cyclodeaminase|uniref:hypothetical protein n=1 Tax=Ferrimicrobium sp. TaxID=2926050 RepID=UPI00260488FA|nr:hypothetical protein [Ferrimicrobium sp.]
MGSGVVVLTEDEIRELVDLDLELVDAIEDGFRVLALGDVATPPPMMFTLDADNEVDVKAVWVPSWGDLSLKVATGFFGNPAKGLPSGNSILLLLDATTGQTRAVLVEGGYLTALRAGAAGAIAARSLAPRRVASAGIVGTGELARVHARALLLAVAPESMTVFGRHRERADAMIEELRGYTDIPLVRAESIQEVVQASDVVVTCTSAREILVHAQWVHPGMHISAVGADAPGKQELDPEILRRADRVVCDLRSQALAQGECQYVTDASRSDDASWLTELGDVVAGKAPGRLRDEELTVCDLTGVGMQDAAIARYVLAKVLGTSDSATTQQGGSRVVT